MSDSNPLLNKNAEIQLLKPEEELEENLYTTELKQDTSRQTTIESEKWLQEYEEEVPEQVLNEKITAAYAKAHKNAKIGKIERYKAKKEFKKKYKTAKAIRKVRQIVPPSPSDTPNDIAPEQIQKNIKATFEEMKTLDVKQFEYANDQVFLERYETDRATLLKGEHLEKQIQQFKEAGGFLDSNREANILVLSQTFKQLLAQQNARLDRLSNPYYLMLREKDFAKMSDANLSDLSNSKDVSLKKMASSLIQLRANTQKTPEQIFEEEQTKSNTARIQRLKDAQKSYQLTGKEEKERFHMSELNLNKKLSLSSKASLKGAGLADREPTKFSLIYLNYCAKNKKTYFDSMNQTDLDNLVKTSSSVLDILENKNKTENTAPLLRNMFDGIIQTLKATTDEGSTPQMRIKSLLPNYNDSGEELGKKIVHMNRFKAFFKDFEQICGSNPETALKAMEGVSEEDFSLYATFSTIFSQYNMASEVANTDILLHQKDDEITEKTALGQRTEKQTACNQYSWIAYIDNLKYSEPEYIKTKNSLDNYIQGKGDIHIPMPKLSSAVFLNWMMQGQNPLLEEALAVSSQEIYKEASDNIKNHIIYFGKQLNMKLENGKPINIKNNN